MSANEKEKREEYLYHNTELLLKKYREVVWSIEVSALQVKMSFELEMQCKSDEFLEMTYDAGADFSGTQIQEQVRTMERNKKMLRMIDAAVSILRKRHANGEEYYWILYYTYLSEKPCKKVEDIINLVEEKTELMTWKTYFKKRKLAIEVLSTILWGFASKDSMSLLEEFVNN